MGTWFLDKAQMTIYRNYVSTSTWKLSNRPGVYVPQHVPARAILSAPYTTRILYSSSILEQVLLCIILGCWSCIFVSAAARLFYLLCTRYQTFDIVCTHHIRSSTAVVPVIMC